MQIKTYGILLFSKVIKENDLFIKVLSNEDKLLTGIVYGGNSSKKKNIYQIGYFLNLRIVKKNSNIPNSIDADISKPLIGSIIEDKYKLYCLLSITSLINLSIVEGQNLNGIFKTTEDFLNILVKKNNWIRSFCLWLFDLLRIIGYDIDYKINNEKKYFDTNLLEFTDNKGIESYDFPHKFLEGNEKISISNIKVVFLIFEYIFKNNHLIHYNNKLPQNYMNFKKIILNYLS